MKCPNCDVDVLSLPSRPLPMNVSTTMSDLTFTDTSGGGAVYVPEEPSHEVFKCCNEKCWVTRIEVDWGQQ